MDDQQRASHFETRRLGHLICAVLILLCSPLDWLELGGFSFLTLGLRLMWAALIAGVGLYLPRGGSSFEPLGGLLAGLGSTALLGALILASGGLAAALSAWMLALPLAVLAMLHVDVRAVAWTSGASLIWTVGLVAAGDSTVVELLKWGYLQAASGAVAVWGALTLRRLTRLREEETQARLQAVSRLALSERHRAQAERMALLGRMASSVAHELNTPLSYVNTNLSCLKESLDGGQQALPPGEVKALVDESQDGLRRIREIVSDLRVYARDEALGLRRAELSGLVAEAVRMGRVRLKHVATVEVDLAPGLPRPLVHERHFVQVLLNLLVNAADALEEANRSGAVVWVRARRVDGGVEVVVEDNGPGIPEEVLPQLFEPFFTTKAPGQGTGLGLPLSRDYMEQMGGTLGACARPGGGARFTLTVPMEEAKSAQPAQRPALFALPAVG